MTNIVGATFTNQVKAPVPAEPGPPQPPPPLLASAPPKPTVAKSGAPIILTGVVLLPSSTQIEKGGVPGDRGVVVRGPAFLNNESFEKELRPFLGKPVTQVALFLIQKRITDWCRKVDHPGVEVVFPEQEVVDGVIQLAVIEGGANSTR
jgi:hemolysin activation/secretion protein